MRQATVLYSRVTARMAIWNSALFSKVRTPVYFLRTPQESILGLAGIYTRLGFWSWGGRPSFSYLLAQLYWDSYQFSRTVRHHHLLNHWTPHASRGVKGMSGPLSRKGRDLGLSLGSPQGIQTSLHLVKWNRNLNLSHCREIWPSFESGHHGVHSTWGVKRRVPLTYVLLR